MNDGYEAFRPFSFAGLNIIESRTPPKLRLHDAVPMSDAFRAEMNAWLLDMFGYQDNPVPIGMAYLFGNTVVMRPEMVARLANLTS